ncbi:DUF5131 family protein [Bosea vaviloviae]|uniref:DUF5131 family protein n=1 Tax=Bosea vaviloviae TaxID=1526658 RepID=UPI0006BB1AF8|nr:phage Gp37/Gp68 family protein [Bosea vaviloviae]
MSNIEWTEATWNPIVGCSVVSPGCTNCYAMTMAARLEAMATLPQYTGTTRRTKAGPVWTGKLALAPEATLLAPLRRRKPTTYFVNSMGDLFHEDVADDWIDRVFAVMALTPQHTYQILTKRSARMRAYLTDPDLNDRLSAALGCMLDGEWIWNEGERFRPAIEKMISIFLGMESDDDGGVVYHDDPMPLPNVWLGVSAEDQRRAEERIPDLLATPAAIRFVSAEPLLGPIDFQSLNLLRYFKVENPLHPNWPRNVFDALRGKSDIHLIHNAAPDWAKLDWVIVGGESGAGARPMEDAWAESIVEQCAAAGTAVFVKQMGGPVKSRMRPIPALLMVRQFPGDGLANRPVCEEA